MVWPITLQPPRVAVTQPFRPTATEAGSVDTGIDIAAPSGTPIRAAAAGVVKSLDKAEGGYGWKLVLDHGDELYTWYAHLSAFAVAVGDRVEAGQTIGAVGTTGLSTGPHLHFEVRVKNAPIDPRLVLP